jgi:hypothetical protein
VKWVAVVFPSGKHAETASFTRLLQIKYGNEKNGRRIEMTDASEGVSGVIAFEQPPSVLVTGGILGGATFLLCALLLGVRAGVAIAAVSMIIAVLRRVRAAALLFGAAAVLSAVALLPSTSALVAAASAFGIALADFARARMRARLGHGARSIRAKPMAST